VQSFILTEVSDCGLLIVVIYIYFFLACVFSDSDLLCEQELEIGENWFLDQKIPAGGFVRILVVAGMERASGRNENHHDGRPDYMPAPRTRMDEY